MFEKQPTDFLNFIHKWLVWNLIKIQNIQIPVILVSLVLKGLTQLSIRFELR